MDNNQKAVFLDRDGVLNECFVKNGKPYPPKTFKEFKTFTFLQDVLFNFKNKGYLTIVVTNQPDPARGKLSKKNIMGMHEFLLENYAIDDIFVCWHANDGECFCRKPLPGMLIEASEKYKINLKKSYLIGDRWRDIDAGNSVGCKTIFIDYKYNEKLNSKPKYLVKSLLETMHLIQ